MSNTKVYPVELIEKKILLIRGQRVILSTHLSELYGVEVRALIQAVKRNIDRFPSDFMFQLTKKEYANLKSHFVISSDNASNKKQWGGVNKKKAGRVLLGRTWDEMPEFKQAV